MENNGNEPEDNGPALYDYMKSLKKGVADWYTDYEAITSPLFEPELFYGRTFLEGIDINEILEADPYESLPDPDDIERRYNSSNFSLNVLKAKKLQRILELENTLAVHHSGEDLKDIGRGTRLTMNGISKFFQHAVELREEPFNKLDAGNVFNAERSIRDLEKIRSNTAKMDDPWKFNKGDSDPKEKILNDMYVLRMEYGAICLQQVAMNLSFARDLLLNAVAAKVLVRGGVIPESHPALQYENVYTELGDDFLQNANDNLQTAGFYLSNVDDMMTDTGRDEPRKVERYVAIDPDFGLR